MPPVRLRPWLTRRPACPSGLRCLAVLAIALAAAIGHAPSPPAHAQTPEDAFIDRVVASLTPNQRVGQLVMVNFVGDDVSAQSDIATLVRDFNVGAVLVTASNGNIVNRDDTPAQLAALTSGLQQRSFETTARSDGANQYFLPLLIATDNEGDLFPFTNVTNGYTEVPNNMTIGATWSKKRAESAGALVGRELSAAGIKTYTEKLDTKDGERTRVRAGPFVAKPAADDARDKIRGLGFAGAQTVAR